MTSPKDILARHFNPPADDLRAEIVDDMPMAEYRAFPAFAPSDFKLADIEGKDRGWRGHPLKMVQRIAGVATDESTPAQEDGTLYHLLVLEPHLFEKQYAVVTPEILAGLIEAAKDRHGQDKFSPHLTEAKEWKAERIRLGLSPEFTDEAKAEILAKADARKRGEVKFHARLTEYVAWCDERAKEGKTVVWPETVQRIKEMADAIHTLPQNRDASRYLSEHLEGARCEASLFLDLNLRIGDEGRLIVRTKARPDMLTKSGDLINLKSARSVHPVDFEKSVVDFGYYFSEGAYGRILQHLGHPVERIGYLCQETQPPYFAKLYWLPYELANLGAAEWERVLRQVANAWANDDWTFPDYNGDLGNPELGETLTWPDWMQCRIDSIPDLLPRTFGF